MPVHVNSKVSIKRLRIIGKLSTQQEQMLQLLGIHGPLTMREAHRLVNVNPPGMELVSVRARCTELLQAGLLEEAGTVKCQYTERTVSKLRLTAKGREAEHSLMEGVPMPITPAQKQCCALLTGA